MSEDFGPHWNLIEFYRSLEQKSVYEVEDAVLERFSSSDGDVVSGAMKRLPYATTLSLGLSASIVPGPSLHRGEQSSV